jgi:hypothetical protein
VTAAQEGIMMVRAAGERERERERKREREREGKGMKERGLIENYAVQRGKNFPAQNQSQGCQTSCLFR